MNVTENVTLIIESREALIDLLSHPDPHLLREEDVIYVVECICGRKHSWKTLDEIPSKNFFCTCGHSLIAYDKET